MALCTGGLAPGVVVHGTREPQVHPAIAGGPDVVFALAFDAFLKLLNAELAARGLQPAVPVAGPGIFRSPGADTAAVPVEEQTYMDDTAVPLEAPQADDIFDMLSDAADALIRVARAFGLVVNFSAGKTEAVVGLHGPGLAAARQRLAALEVAGEGGPVPVLPIPGMLWAPDRPGLQAPRPTCCRQRPHG